MYKTPLYNDFANANHFHQLFLFSFCAVKWFTPPHKTEENTRNTIFNIDQPTTEW